MPRKKTPLKYTKERAVLSDVLPYEVPISFSNRHFYDFLLSNRLEYKNNKVSWLSDEKEDTSTDYLIKILFGVPHDQVVTRESEKKDIPKLFKKSFKLEQLESIPFCYKISHKENEYRELTIPHPRNQVQVVDFYHSCKEIILYYCAISQFSIRYPNKISKYTFYKDRTHYQNLSEDSSNLEQHNTEYENLRSFFVYKDYSNVYKFYESYKFHRCEKKYNKLLKLDISKCFDSIYTHSIAWALINKELVKESRTESRETFAGRFDTLMQNINYNETNGIIIGPEFSRIFAELILQSVDNSIYKNLLNKYNLKHKVDYEIFRYVDDYFIFFNDEASKDKVLEVIQVVLKEYKLSLNSAKSITYEKPIITEISIAKERIKNLLNEKLVYKSKELKSESSETEALTNQLQELKAQLNQIQNHINPSQGLKTELDESSNNKKSGIGININSTTLITQFKTIIKECSVDYKDMLNYALSIIESQSGKIIKAYHKADKSHRSEKQLTQAIIAILEFVFFIYSGSARVNTTIKLCRILEIFCAYMKNKSINQDSKDNVFKYIYDGVCLILKKNKNNEHTQVETLYLLILLSELGQDYLLEQNILAQYFGLQFKTKEVEDKATANELDIDSSMKIESFNYFSITVILLYIRKKKRYNDFRSVIENEIERRFNIKDKESKDTKAFLKNAELTMLFLDTISCPYISDETKRKLLSKYAVPENMHDSPENMHDSIIDQRLKNKPTRKQLWFTTWKGFNIGKALYAKRSQEVY